jgi:small subunit ribosomal protein S4
MIIGPRYKICRRLGSGVFDKCQTQTYTLSEGRKTKTRGGKAPSDFGRQLLEKQKIRFSFGLTERQLGNYVADATGKHGTDPVRTLIASLESRIDNVVYRAGLAASRRQARQLVSHGHVLINGRRTTVPSHRVSVGDTFSVREGSKISPFFATRKEALDRITPPVWLSFDATTLVGSMTALPTPETAEVAGDIAAVLEFYSR